MLLRRLTWKTGQIVNVLRFGQKRPQPGGGHLLNAAVAQSHITLVLMQILGPACAASGDVIGPQPNHFRLVDVSTSLLASRSRHVGDIAITGEQPTEQEQTREALARSERELKHLFEDASVGLLVVSRCGKILRANRAFLNLVDTPAKNVIGRSLKRFHSDPALVDHWLGLLAQEQKFQNVSTQFRAANSQTRSVLVDANALWEKGQFVHSHWFVRDISQRKRLERELIELSERERRSVAQELHDGLGQQLGGIAYLSNVLRERLVERRAPEAGDAARIFGLVRNAIDQTRRVARGLAPIRPELDGLMDALRDLAAQTTELFGVRCRWVCPRPVMVADAVGASHLFRIAQEAVNNALKHARARTITLRLRRDGARVCVTVKDDGCGIDISSRNRKGLGLRILR